MSEKIETPVIDKSTWGPGPWQDEPDRVDFVAHGFACFVKRHPRHGHYCGYVGVPREHPAYGKSYQDIDVEVHGGMSYSHTCEGDICHVPAPGMPADVWWLGFACASVSDKSPGMDARLAQITGQPGDTDDLPEGLREVYRELPYVRAETEALAGQLAAFMP
jgi:hypothetical protein